MCKCIKSWFASSSPISPSLNTTQKPNKLRQQWKKSDTYILPSKLRSASECIKSISLIGLIIFSPFSSEIKLQWLPSTYSCRKLELSVISLGQSIESSRNWALKLKMTKKLEKKNINPVSMKSLGLNLWANTRRNVFSASFSFSEKRRRFWKKSWKTIIICIPPLSNKTHSNNCPPLKKLILKTNPVWVKAVHPNNHQCLSAN